MKLTTQKAFAGKALHATIGAPVVVGRKVRELGSRMTDSAQDQLDAFATEGEKLTSGFRSRNYVEEIQSRIDIEKVQNRVETLRDQLEGTLAGWRESFTPPAAPTAAPKKAPAKSPVKKARSGTKVVAKKSPAKKSPAKTAAAKKAPAKKGPAAKK